MGVFELNHTTELGPEHSALGIQKTNLVHPTASPVKIILLDDDPIFGQVIARYTKNKNIALDVCHTASDFAESLTRDTYHVAILDYYLDNYTGTQIAPALGDLPAILVSRKSQWIKSEPSLPDCIRKFVHKKYGAEAILDAAVQIATCPEKGE